MPEKVPGGGCPRFIYVKYDELKKKGRTLTKDDEIIKKRPAESIGIDIKLVSFSDILSRDRHKTASIAEEL
jgi:hypothetical protein